MNIVSYYYAGDCILKILFSSYRNLLIIQSVHHITFILCYTVYGFFMDYLVGSMSYISFCVTNFLFEKKIVKYVGSNKMLHNGEKNYDTRN